jgi:hypothetical protein
MPYAMNQRILDEKALLERTLSQFKLHRIGNDLGFIGWQTASIRNWTFQLKLLLPKNYPHQRPDLYVIEPTVLNKCGGGTINQMENSHAFHTREKGPQGCVSICHYNHSSWDASRTCLGVFTKGILWVEAYASHLVTGRTIADILDDWARNQARN